MDNAQPARPLSSDQPERQLTTDVTPSPQGGWVAVVNLGEGATVSKWFDDEQEAQHYEEALLEWLAQRSA
jgi:hypothetical protein